LGRTEAARQITNEPWSSMQRSKKLTRPLSGVNGEVCKKKRKKLWKERKKDLTPPVSLLPGC
jgi:hypothetical protein